MSAADTIRRVCVPRAPGAGGGLSTFLGLFEAELARRQVEVLRTPAGCDALLVPAWTLPYTWVWDAKRANPILRVVHRIDGSARDYGRRDGSDRRQARLNMLADTTIFQSAYGRHATTHKFKVIHQDGCVVHNPVDLSRFHPGPPRVSPRPQLLHVTHSTNAMKGVVDLVEATRRTGGCDWSLVGRYDGLPALPHVKVVGELRGEELACAYRAHDLLVTFSRNDTCPNVVLEALASGLGVLHLDSGGIPELVGDCGRVVTPDSIADVVGPATEEARHGTLAARARARAEAMFAPSAVVGRYLQAMAEATRRPLPSWAEWLRLLRAGYPVWGCGAAERASRWCRDLVAPRA